LGEHVEEARWKITELEALCKKHDEDAQKLRKENAKLEGMVESHDKLIMEFTDKFGYNHMDEGTDNEDDDDDDGGDPASAPAAVPPLLVCHLLLLVR
jgi:hypothetical protein